MRTKKRYRVNERFFWTITFLILAVTLTWLISDYNRYQANHQPAEETSVMTVEEYQDQIPKPSKTISIGTFKITHYTASIECCGKTDGITASGAPAKEDHTVAADPNILPLGTEVIIDGQVYTVEDTGGAIKGNKLDIYVGSMDEAISRGVIQREVFIIKK